MTREKILKIHKKDDLIVALCDLKKGEEVELNGQKIVLVEDIPLKHKFTCKDFKVGEMAILYGVVVGRVIKAIKKGALITVSNLKHDREKYQESEGKFVWEKPDISKFQEKTFMGYHRSDGSVGTANYWLVLPLVFCENRNVLVLKEAFSKILGYQAENTYKSQIETLIELYKKGKTIEEIEEFSLEQIKSASFKREVIFKNVDGIKFLTHQSGCGETKEDSRALCSLLAGYITHPNVCGATVLSLGCQHAQVNLLKEEINKKDTHFNKPLYVFEQQKVFSEKKLIEKSIQSTFVGLMKVDDQCIRKEAPISKLIFGVECGASDGFSGISANPVIGQVVDFLTACGGSAILSEFPELCGVEQELINRCATKEVSKCFVDLMELYEKRAAESGSGFDMNPSPGNIKDGLITDAIKSAGAAKKGGTGEIIDVLDYSQKIEKQGLNLLCTPGNDVESVTALVGSGSNLVLFSTGLGTPTGNPIAPVIKISTTTRLFENQKDMIDFDTGAIISGKESIQSLGEKLLNFAIKVASGELKTKAFLLQQEDFIPWKRGISL